MHDQTTVNAKKRLTVLFPWLSLIPFVLYIPVGIFINIPTNTINSTHPRLASLGSYLIPLALIAALTLFLLGIAALLQKQLYGWKKWMTLAGTVIHGLLILTFICGFVVFLVLLFAGQLSH